MMPGRKRPSASIRCCPVALGARYMRRVPVRIPTCLELQSQWAIQRRWGLWNLYTVFTCIYCTISFTILETLLSDLLLIQNRLRLDKQRCTIWLAVHTAGLVCGCLCYNIAEVSRNDTLLRHGHDMLHATGPAKLPAYTWTCWTSGLHENYCVNVTSIISTEIWNLRLKFDKHAAAHKQFHHVPPKAARCLIAWQMGAFGCKISPWIVGSECFFNGVTGKKNMEELWTNI